MTKPTPNQYPIHDYSHSPNLFERARAVIPNGIGGHFNPAVQVPAGTYPFYVDRARGSRFWDVDGNEYIDLMCAYGPMILGYENLLTQMLSMAQDILDFDHILTFADYLEDIESVTALQMQEAAEEVFASQKLSRITYRQ